MADISKLTLPSGTTYNIKDAKAREDIASIEQSIAGGVSFIGETTTAISDGSTTNPIVINGNNHTAISGNLVVYGKKEFVFDGTKWIEFGDLGTLKALAFKDSASGSFTPQGNVSAPTFTGAESSIVFDIEENPATTSPLTGIFYTPKGSVSQPSFTGSNSTFTGSYTPSGTISFDSTWAYARAHDVSPDQNANYQPKGEVTLTKENKTISVSSTTGTATYTPSGTVSAPTISVATAGATTTIKNPTSTTCAKTVAVAAPGATAPSNNLTYYSVSGETLSLYQIGYTTGAAITTSNVTVKTGDAAYSATAPTFTGSGARLVTESISIPSQAQFSGQWARIEAPYPSTIGFTGTAGNVSVSGTPSGTVSQPTFTGTKILLDGTTTAAGTNSAPTFTGTAGTITVS